MQVPPQLNYNQLQTKAFFSIFKSWPIQPVSNGSQYWPGQVVRIFLNALTDGVMDPYRSFLQITVQSSQQTLPIGLLQVDNSAQSFISQMVISSKNRQVQRIVQYGVLACYLNDIGYSQIYTQGKQFEGLGHSTIGNYTNIYSQTYSAPSYNQISSQNYQNGARFSVGNSGAIFPTIPVRNPTASSFGQQSMAGFLAAGINRGHINKLNPAWIPQIQPWWTWKFILSDINATYNRTNTSSDFSMNYFGYAYNVRAQYLSSMNNNQYVDAPNSFSKTTTKVVKDPNNFTFPMKFKNGYKYRTYNPPDLSSMMHFYLAGGHQRMVLQKVPNITSLYGFSNLFSPNFARGVRQPFISPTVPQCQIKNGQILQQKVPVSKRTFKIPIMSALIGLLIPQNQFVLLPLRALNDTLIELTMDPYAMFTSGYNDISQYDDVGMGLMQKRAFKITRMVYNLHTYQFYNPQMDQYLRVSLSTGIAINTKFWQMGNQYQIQNSQTITNSWPIACNQEALNQIVTLFYPLDYQNLSFCRKHFRISNNIIKLQLRINMQYFPSQPLTGNGGNPIQLDASGNNSVFIEQIYLNQGILFDKNTPPPRINPYNFAINDRCYNIYNTNTLYDTQMLFQQDYIWSNQSVNYDTALGIANVHQNRYVGKAAYVFSFQPYSHSKNFLTGIDCRAAKSFQIMFASNSQGYFPRPQVMFIYTASSVIIQYSKDGIVNINK